MALKPKSHSNMIGFQQICRNICFSIPPLSSPDVAIRDVSTIRQWLRLAKSIIHPMLFRCPLLARGASSFRSFTSVVKASWPVNWEHDEKIWTILWFIHGSWWMHHWYRRLSCLNSLNGKLMFIQKECNVTNLFAKFWNVLWSPLTAAESVSFNTETRTSFHSFF